MTINYGIIGCGMMGAEHIRNIALLDGARVTAVTDPISENMTGAVNLAGNGCSAYSTVRELLDNGNCNALVLASPNHTHYDLLLQLMESGLPILAEKPLCITLDQCRAALDRRTKGRSTVWVAMEYRYIAPVARLIEAAHRGDAGRIRMLSIREHRFPFLRKFGDWNRFSENTGGTLVEKCCHFFDLMRLLARSEPVRIYASGAMDVNFLDESYDGRRPDILDNAFVTVDFTNGLRAMLELCMFNEGSVWQERVAAIGDIASIEARVPGPARFSPDGRQHHSEIEFAFRQDRRVVRETVNVDASILAAGDHHGSTFFQHEKFLEMVRQRGQAEVTLEDGMLSVAMGQAAEISAKTGQVIDFADFLNCDDAA